MGFEGDTVTLQILDTEGNVLFTGEPAVMAGWTTVLSECQRAFVTFHLEEETAIKLQVCIGMNDGGWGSADAMYLHAHANLHVEDNGDGTQDVSCGDCGEFLTVQEKEEDQPDVKPEEKPDTEDTTDKEDGEGDNKPEVSPATGDQTKGSIYLFMMAVCIVVVANRFSSVDRRKNL